MEVVGVVGEQGYTLNEMNLEGVRVKLVQLVAADGFKHSEMMANQHHRSLSSTTRLDKHTQLTTGLPWRHEYSRLLVRIARGPRKSSQQKQTSYHKLCPILIVRLWSFAFVWKNWFLSWAIRPFLSDLVIFPFYLSYSIVVLYIWIMKVWDFFSQNINP